MKAQVFEGTKENFSELVLENSRRGLVLVDFWSPKAGPSLRQREILLALVDEMADRFLLVTVNTDLQTSLAQQYGVRSIPSCRLFRNGRVIEELRGMQPAADYRAVVQRHLVPLGDRVRLSATKAWKDGDHDKALQVLAEGAMAEPDNLEIPAMLGKLLIRLGRYQDAQRVLTNLPEQARQQANIATLLAHLDVILTAQGVTDLSALRSHLEREPADLEALYQDAAVRLVNDDYEGCMAALTAILQRDRTWQCDRARRALLAVFDALGADHELVGRYRNLLSRLIH